MQSRTVKRLSRSPRRNTRPGEQSNAAPKRPSVRLLIAGAYGWVMMTLFGAIVLETVMVYPNIFADPPRSLELTMQFLAVSGPSDFFPPLGFLSWVLGAAALAAWWGHPRVRWLLLLSVAMILCEGIASMLYFWPRNDIMFVEGVAVHGAQRVIQAAHEFEVWHWRSRMLFNTVAAICAFAAFTTAHTITVLARAQTKVPAR